MVLFLVCTIPFLDLEHHPHDLVDPVPRPRRARSTRLLLQPGLIHEPLEFLLFSDFAVVLAYMHLYTLFMVTPIFNTMMRIDRRLHRGGASTAAPGLADVAHVVVPLCKPGIAIGSIFVVTLVMGDFITVRLMSGGQSASVGADDLQPDLAAAVPRRLRQCRGAAGGRAADDRGDPPHRRHPEGAVSRDLWSGAGGGMTFGLVGRLALTAFFGLFVLFLYGPTLTIVVLSFQGPDGGLTFPMNGVSLHWFAHLFEQQAVGDFGGCSRSLAAARPDRDDADGGDLALPPASPSAAASAAVGAAVHADRRQPDHPFDPGQPRHRPAVQPERPRSRLVQLRVRRAAHLDAAVRPADHVRGVQPLQPRLGGSGAAISGPRPGSASGMWCCRSSGRVWSGVALFGFTLSYDEFARTLLTAGSDNTLPLEIFGMTTNVTTPVLYALGTVTTGLSFLVIAVALIAMAALRRAADRRSG